MTASHGVLFLVTSCVEKAPAVSVQRSRHDWYRCVLTSYVLAETRRLPQRQLMSKKQRETAGCRNCGGWRVRCPPVLHHAPPPATHPRTPSRAHRARASLCPGQLCPDAGLAQKAREGRAESPARGVRPTLSTVTYTLVWF